LHDLAAFGDDAIAAAPHELATTSTRLSFIERNEFAPLLANVLRDFLQPPCEVGRRYSFDQLAQAHEDRLCGSSDAVIPGRE
jgi:hypothetical protein